MLYYFAQEVDQAPYGFIRGACKRGDHFETPYKWLSQYCNFFPPLFVSSDQRKLSGYSLKSNKVLFGFKSIRGYPVDYDQWINVAGMLINLDTTDFSLMDKTVVDGLHELEQFGDIDLGIYKSYEDYLRRAVFIEKNQFAVPSLDLRKTSVILCNNEVQRSSLIRKGFPSQIVKLASFYSQPSL